MAERYKVDQRAALFGNRNGKAAARADTIGAPAGHSSSVAEAMQRQNDAHIDELANKVAQFKEITRGVAKEVKESGSFMDAMGINFDKAGSMLKGTVQHLTKATQRKSGRMGLMVAIFVCLFFVLYLASHIRSSRGTGGNPPGTAVGAIKGLALQQNATFLEANRPNR